MSNKKSVTVIAISALVSLLATGAFMSSEIAFACGHHHSKSMLQTAAQANICGNGIMSLDITCQNQGNQVNGDHNAANVTGIHPSNFGQLDHGNSSQDDHGSSPSGGSSPSSYIPSGNPITGADP